MGYESSFSRSSYYHGSVKNLQCLYTEIRCTNSETKNSGTKTIGMFGKFYYYIDCKPFCLIVTKNIYKFLEYYFVAIERLSLLLSNPRIQTRQPEQLASRIYGSIIFTPNRSHFFGSVVANRFHTILCTK